MYRRSVGGERHPPFTDLHTLTEKALYNVNATDIVRGTVQCSITYMKEFDFGERRPYKLKVGVHDGRFSREIFIHHDVVQRNIGFSPQEVVDALKGSGTQRTEVKSRLKTFQMFLIGFEGTMVVEMSGRSPCPVAVELNPFDATLNMLRSSEGLRLSEGLDARTEKENLGGRWLFDLFYSDNFMSVIWFVIGTPCSFYAPQHLLKGILARIISFLMVGGFLALAFLGLKYRRCVHLRMPPSKFGWKCLMLGITSVITVLVSLTYKTSELSILGFSVLAGALFSLTMIVQPATDGGLLQFFAWMPFQVAVGHYRVHIHKTYVPTFLMAPIFLVCQTFFSQHLDADYAHEVEYAIRREEQQKNYDNVLHRYV